MRINKEIKNIIEAGKDVILYVKSNSRYLEISKNFGSYRVDYWRESETLKDYEGNNVWIHKDMGSYDDENSLYKSLQGFSFTVARYDVCE